MCLPPNARLRAKKGATNEDDFDDGFRSRVQGDLGCVLRRSGPVVLPDGVRHGPERSRDLISGFGTCGARGPRVVRVRNRRILKLSLVRRASLAALAFAALEAFGIFSLP